MGGWGVDRCSQGRVCDNILDAAIDCIVGSGVDTVQITQIAAGAGISTRTLNRYYPEKNGLLSEAASKFLWKTYTTIIEEYEKVNKTGTTGLERLLLFLKLWKDYYRTDAVEAMMFIDMKMSRVRHGMKKYSWTVPGGDRIKEIVIDALERGKQDGSIRDGIDSSRASALVTATYNGVIQRKMCLSCSASPQEAGNGLLDIFNDYIDMLVVYVRS